MWYGVDLLQAKELIFYAVGSARKTWIGKLTKIHEPHILYQQEGS